MIDGVCGLVQYCLLPSLRSRNRTLLLPVMLYYVIPGRYLDKTTTCNEADTSPGSPLEHGSESDLLLGNVVVTIMG